jgi:acyl dehydratase
MAIGYFEDHIVGAVFEFGETYVSEEEIVAFARRYDPQPFHIDPIAAEASPYGGIIASGWHTASMMMRMLVDHVISGESSLGSPGIDALRWNVPVRDGDVLGVRLVVASKRESQTRPDRGIVVYDIEVHNQRGEIPLSVSLTGFIRRRP